MKIYKAINVLEKKIKIFFFAIAYAMMCSDAIKDGRKDEVIKLWIELEPTIKDLVDKKIC